MSGIKTTKQQYRLQQHICGICLLLVLLLVPVAGFAGGLTASAVSLDSIDYPMPTADRPAEYTGGPVSIPVTTLMKRLASSGQSARVEAKRFRYDIDSLGLGLAVRLHFKF
jgi:hypothetical protein